MSLARSCCCLVPENTPVFSFDYYEPRRQPVRASLLAREGWIAVQPGKPYTLSAMMKADRPGKHVCGGVSGKGRSWRVRRMVETEKEIVMKIVNSMLCCVVLLAVPVAADEPKLAFVAGAQPGEFLFNTGLLKGSMHRDGKASGVQNVVYVPKQHPGVGGHRLVHALPRDLPVDLRPRHQVGPNRPGADPPGLRAQHL